MMEEKEDRIIELLESIKANTKIIKILLIIIIFLLIFIRVFLGTLVWEVMK